MALVGISMLGILVRSYGLASDLWIDEISTLIRSRGPLPWELLRSYSSPNQHVLNSLLLNLSIGAFGEHEWSVRLPAMIFGALCIPAMYWLARCCRFTRAMSLSAALLLAVNYHHIAFSQNARGYTGYVLFSLLATACLVRLLERPQKGLAVAYVCAMGLNFLALLPSVFLFAAHVLAAGTFLVLAHRRGEQVRGGGRTVVGTFGATAGLATLIYLPVLSAIATNLSSSDKLQTTAFQPSSIAFLRETVEGIAAGFGGGFLLAALPLMVLGTVGLWVLSRRAWIVVTVIILSQLMFFGMTVVVGWSIYPRFFILALPLGFLALLSTFEVIGFLVERWGPSRLSDAGPAISVTLVGLVTATSIAALPRYYATPKQPNRAAVEEIARRIGDHGVAVAAGTADRGFNYYAPRLGLPASRARTTRTVPGLNSITAEFSANEVFILTTFQSAFEVENPDLAAAVSAGWARAKVFPAAVRGAEIILWEPKR
jgi:4-amino-4-deoxy-L-arabinose transferase-like glycosyltransferase